MEEPAMEMFTRSRNATALNTNSQNTRSHRVWLMEGGVIRLLAHSQVWQRAGIQALWALNNSVNWSAMMRSSPGCNMKEFIDKPCSEALRMIGGSDFFRIAPASLGVMAI